MNDELIKSNNYYVGRIIVDAPYTLKKEYKFEAPNNINDTCIDIGGCRRTKFVLSDKYVPVCHYKFYNSFD